MQPLFLYVGRSRNWVYLLFKGNKPEFRYILRFLYFLFTSVILKILRLYENFKYCNAIKKEVIVKDPIFIIGHMRSGTTYLHNLLSLDNRFGYLSTFEAYAPEFSIVGKRIFHLIIKAFVPKKRIMDNMEISANLPQEEEF